MVLSNIEKDSWDKCFNKLQLFESCVKDQMKRYNLNGVIITDGVANDISYFTEKFGLYLRERNINYIQKTYPYSFGMNKLESLKRFLNIEAYQLKKDGVMILLEDYNQIFGEYKPDSKAGSSLLKDDITMEHTLDNFIILHVNEFKKG